MYKPKREMNKDKEYHQMINAGRTSVLVAKEMEDFKNLKAHE